MILVALAILPPTTASALMLGRRMWHRSQRVLRLMLAPSTTITAVATTFNLAHIADYLPRIDLQQTTRTNLTHFIAHKTLHNARVSLLHRAHNQPTPVCPNVFVATRIHVVDYPVHLWLRVATIVLAVQLQTFALVGQRFLGTLDNGGRLQNVQLNGVHQRWCNAVVQAAHVDATVGAHRLQDLQTKGEHGGAIIVDGSVGAAPHGLGDGVSDAGTLENGCIAQTDHKFGDGLSGVGDEKRGRRLGRLVRNGDRQALWHLDFLAGNGVDSRTRIDARVVWFDDLQDQGAVGQLGERRRY